MGKHGRFASCKSHHLSSWHRRKEGLDVKPASPHGPQSLSYDSPQPGKRAGSTIPKPRGSSKHFMSLHRWKKSWTPVPLVCGRIKYLQRYLHSDLFGRKKKKHSAARHFETEEGRIDNCQFERGEEHDLLNYRRESCQSCSRNEERSNRPHVNRNRTHSR